MSTYFTRRYRLLLDGKFDELYYPDYDGDPPTWLEEHYFHELVINGKFPIRATRMALDYPEKISKLVRKSYLERYYELKSLFIFNAQRPVSYWLMWIDLTHVELQRMVPNIIRELGYAQELETQKCSINSAFSLHKSRYTPDLLTSDEYWEKIVESKIRLWKSVLDTL